MSSSVWPRSPRNRTHKIGQKQWEGNDSRRLEGLGRSSDPQMSTTMKYRNEHPGSGVYNNVVPLEQMREIDETAQERGTLFYDSGYVVQQAD